MLPALDMGGVEKGTLELARFLVENGHRSIVIADGGRMVSDLLTCGSEYFSWDVGAKRITTLRWIRRVRRLLVDVDADILHLRSRLPAWIGYLAWRGLPAQHRPRLVTTVHGPYSVGRYSAVMMYGERVIAISNTIREYIIKNYPFVDASRIRIIHRGVDRRQYPYNYLPQQAWIDEWRRSFPGLENKFLVTLPARITRWKGQQDFVLIIARLKTLGLPVHGLIVGGPHRRRKGFLEELQTDVRHRGLENDITFTGHRQDLRDIMAVSDVVLSLAKEPEAFGRTTLEALAIGKPVAGYDHGGVAEQLAAIFPSGCVALNDIDGMVRLLAQWYERSPLVPREIPFTRQKMLNDTLAVYTELLPNGSP